MRTPQYLKFESESGGKYLFDSQSGAVMPVNALIEKAIDLYASNSIDTVGQELAKVYPAEEVDGVLDFVQRWNRLFGGFYRDGKSTAETREKMASLAEKDVQKHLLDGNTFQLVLNLTEDCNFRCTYCYLSEMYDYTRNRTSSRLSLETGIKALDLYFTIVKPIATKIPGKQIGVSFYGGEPLLRFATLKELIDYVLAHSPVPVVFNMTTNGYLLTDAMMDFLVEKEVNVAISLDGSKENHDRNRVLPNGQGTFDVVYRNIKRFQERHPDYAKLSTISVYDMATDLEANVRFFDESKVPRIVFLNAASDVNTSYYERFSDEDRKRFYQQRDGLLRRYLDLKKAGKPAPEFLRAFFEPEFAGVVLRPKRDDVRPFMAPYTATCVPGFKFSVRADGTLDLCERVNGTLPIGHVDTGPDYAAMKRILSLYDAGVTKQCDSCALSKNCTACYAQCNRNCGFSLPEAWCERLHARFRQSFAILYSVLEKRPDAFANIERQNAEDILYYA